MSVTELAVSVGVAVSTISRVERGQRGMSPRNIKALAVCLGVRPEAITSPIERAAA